MTLQASIDAIGHIVPPDKALQDCPKKIETEGSLCELVIRTDLSDGQQVAFRAKNFDSGWSTQTVQSSASTLAVRVSSPEFSLRTFNRRNPIGAATLTIEQINDNVIFVRGLDCLDGTPPLDIKPAMASE